jgi:hypothetical protein
MPHRTVAPAARAARARSPGPRVKDGPPAPPVQASRSTVTSLGGYAQADLWREIVAFGRDDRTTLVVDRIAETHEDPRLLGELFPEETLKSARQLAREYLTRPPAQRRCCPYTAAPQQAARRRLPRRLVDAEGNVYRIQRVLRADDWGADLRWVRVASGAREPEPLTLREVLAALEDYEPALAMSEHAIAAHPNRGLARLRRELASARNSPTVLNRRLREAVQAEVARGTSLAEIAKRCGHLTRTATGAHIGDTAWLARRVGLANEHNGTPQRWIEPQVLAQIAHALSLAPAEVEL